MEFLFAKTCVPSAKTMVTIAGSPSGIAATASATDVINSPSGSFP